MKKLIVGLALLFSSFGANAQFYGNEYPYLCPPDSVSQPCFNWSLNTQTGMYQPAIGQIGFAINGVNVGGFNSSGFNLTGPLLLGDGTVGAPAYSFSGAPTTGFFRNSTLIFWSQQGVAGGVLGFGVEIPSTAAYYWSSIADPSGSPDLSLFRDTANTLAQRNITNPQTFRIYNTFTDASNYERGTLGWTANQLVLRTEAGGTGTGTRNLIFGVNGINYWAIAGGAAGALYAQTDNTTDIGTSGANRPKSIYWGTQALAPDGSAGTPGFGFANSSNSGFYRDSAGVLTWTQAGSATVAFGSSIALVAATDRALNWYTAVGTGTYTPQAGLAYEAANTLGFRNGTNAQIIRFYNTYTDASNYERGFARWVGNVFEIGNEQAGTGTGRNVVIKSTGASIRFNAASGGADQWGIAAGTGHFLAVTDNTFDFGATGATRPRDIYTSRHYLSQAATPPTMGACGTTPSITGSDQEMTVTVGTGGVATACVVNFGANFGAAPNCIAQNNTDKVSYSVTTAVGSVTVNAAAAFTASSKFFIHCGANS